jgi:hypothetical protein
MLKQLALSDHLLDVVAITRPKMIPEWLWGW